MRSIIIFLIGVISICSIKFFLGQSEIKKLKEQLYAAQSMQQICNGTIKKMDSEAKERAELLKKAIEEATKKATVHKKRADEILATPSAVAANDCESAIIRARSWMAANSS